MKLFSKYVFNDKNQVVAALRKRVAEQGVPSSLKDVYALLDDVLGDCYRLEFPEVHTVVEYAFSSVLVSLTVLYETGEVMFTRQQWGVGCHGNMPEMVQGGIFKGEVHGFGLILSDLHVLTPALSKELIF